MPDQEPDGDMHFMYRTNQGMVTACGVCLRNKCTEDPEKVTHLICKRLLSGTNLLQMLIDEGEID